MIQLEIKEYTTSEQETSGGEIPSDDLLAVQISPGKAYIKGYKIEKISTTFIDVEKPRETATIEQEAVTYETGNPIFVNNISGSPSLGIGTTATVALMGKRKGNVSASSSIVAVSLGFSTSMKVVAIFSILYPLIYAFPGDT